MDRFKKAFVLNLVIFLLVMFAVAWMMTGIKISDDGDTLTAARFASLKFFTVDSNIFMGLVALVLEVEDAMVIMGRKSDLPKWCYVLNLLGVVGVTLTMLVTIFFLAPTNSADGKWILYFKNSNFLMHLIIPILSILNFLLFERTEKINFALTFTGVIPMFLYAIYYTSVTVFHTSDGIIANGYDWYGFFKMGVQSIVFVAPLFFLITYLITLALWRLNRIKNRD